MKYILILFLSMLIITVYSEQERVSYIDNQWPDDRYIDHGNGTVTDIKTKLMWKKCSEGQTGNSCSGSTANYPWNNALAVAESSTFAGYSDWRVPNIKELASLVALDRNDPTININIFPNTASLPYWSASPFTYTRSAWQVDFLEGDNKGFAQNGNYPVRLVRFGQ